MRTLLLVALIILFACNEDKPEFDAIEKFRGMWKLLETQSKNSNGTWEKDSLYAGGTGYIIYDGAGHMSVQMTPRGYREFEWTIGEEGLEKKVKQMTESELRPALLEFASNFVYVANYRLLKDSAIIEHMRLTGTDPNSWNTTVRRTYEFRQDTLILGITDGLRRLLWLKQK
jgi:hypothetical protein